MGLSRDKELRKNFGKGTNYEELAGALILQAMFNKDTVTLAVGGQ